MEKLKYVIIALGLKGSLGPEKNDPSLAIYQDTDYPLGYKQLKEGEAAKWEPVGLWVEVLGNKKALARFLGSTKGQNLLRNVEKAVAVQVKEEAPKKNVRKAPKRRAPARKAKK